MPEPVTTKSNQEKFKVVIFVGDNSEAHKEKILLYIKTRNLKGVKLITGKVEDMKLTDLQGMTDDNTMFIVSVHGHNYKSKDSN